MIVIYVLLVLTVVLEFGTFVVYGGPISKDTTDMYMLAYEDEISLNVFNKSILHINSKILNRYISTLPFSIFSKYYIYGLGVVPRWSKLHKKINQYFIVATKNDTYSLEDDTYVKERYDETRFPETDSGLRHPGNN